MSALAPFLILDQACEQVQARVSQHLTSLGFRIVQTFDLHVARLAHTDCSCPHHGTIDCNCQMVVLLIYQEQGEPATLVIHGQDARTWISLVHPAGKRASQCLETVIRRGLIPESTNLLAPIEAPYEARSVS